ncbi:MAG: thymidine phosphorylase [Acidimicrobiales bacterium]
MSGTTLETAEGNMTTDLNPVDLITAKRDGKRLDRTEIAWFLERYAAGDGVSDAQAAAMAMAIFFRGLDGPELADWTEAMIRSGTRLDLSGIAQPTVDKHSTGGVGDKISLVLVPLVAACGAAVPQLSGRGLGHTGGTLDKMEAIPGWRAELTPDELRAQLQTVGGVIAGASQDLAPADRRLYALRDVTATVDSIPLIASSIMSKKIAEGCQALVLDVKAGSGAFMTDPGRAKQLGLTMVELGRAYGVKTSALITAMDNILGRTAGNSLEVQEALDVLAGEGPADVVELTVALATEMLRLVEIDADPAAILKSGQALEVFDRMVSCQGGDLSRGLPVAAHRATVESPRTGFVSGLEARSIGIAAWRLGAGRAAKDDPVSLTAGVRCLAGIGDRIEAGEPVFQLHGDDPDIVESVRPLVERALDVTDDAPRPRPLVLDRIVDAAG